jgi:hypothetical protein
MTLKKAKRSLTTMVNIEQSARRKTFQKTCFNYQIDAQFLYSVIYVLH